MESEHCSQSLVPYQHATSQIVFKNMASRPYSIYPHGLTIGKSDEGVNYPAGGSVSLSSQTNATLWSGRLPTLLPLNVMIRSHCHCQATSLMALSQVRHTHMCGECLRRTNLWMGTPAV